MKTNTKTLLLLVAASCVSATSLNQIHSLAQDDSSIIEENGGTCTKKCEPYPKPEYGHVNQYCVECAYECVETTQYDADRLTYDYQFQQWYGEESSYGSGSDYGTVEHRFVISGHIEVEETEHETLYEDSSDVTSGYQASSGFCIS